MTGPLDLLLPALAAALSLMTGVWLLSLARRDASIVDVFWGLGFVLVAWLAHWLAPAETPRKTLVAGLVTLWGVRLALYILWRNWGQGEDFRYRAMRERHGRQFAWRSLFVVFWLQGVILWIVSSPILQAVASPRPAALEWLDMLGVAVFAAGILFESVGDLQLARFKADPAHRGKVLQRGLWRYTRHPNYFGDALVWWGLSLIALATPQSLWILVSPLLMTFLLMRVSGVALLEKTLRDTKPAYRDYVSRTNTFFPWFPRRRG